MKTFIFLLLGATIASAQTPSLNANAGAATVATANLAKQTIVGYQTGVQDGNSQVWQKIVQTTDDQGNVSYQTNSAYTELATGLNHLVNGQWVASKENIEISADGNSALATNGQHQAYFPGDIYSGQIELVTPDGKQLFSRPVGLSYFDGKNSVLIAELTNSTGEILPSGNQVLYWAAGALLEGAYTLAVTNAAGSTNVGTWNIRVLLPGMVAAWGDDTYDECDRPLTLTNAMALAAGEFHSVAVMDGGSVVQWGYNWGSVPTNLTNATAVAAGYSHTLALRSDGTITAWGNNTYGQTNVPANATNAIAVAAGGQQSLALLQNGTVVQWGLTNAAIPAGLGNVTAIAAGTNFCLALLSNATVVAWGNNTYGQTNVPANLTNVMAIAAGGTHALALLQNGTIVSWGDNIYGETNVPANLTNAMAIAAGDAHSVALLNNGTVVAWGDNAFGETNVPGALTNIKLIAAGGYHTLASMFSWTVQYPVDVTKDLLLIYNTNSISSATVENYYLQNRPMVSGANVLGIGCPGIFVTNGGGGGYYPITNTIVYETVTHNDFTNQIIAPLQTWLNNNPTKRPQYVILFLDVPSRVYDSATNGANYPFDYFTGGNPSVSYQLATAFPGWNPFVTHINMNGTNDCIAYINKLAFIGTNYSPGKIIISASAGNYGNTNYYFDNTGNISITPNVSGLNASNAVIQAGASPASVAYTSVIYTPPSFDPSLQYHITNGVNVAGYLSDGSHSFLGTNFATNGYVQWSGNSSWWIIDTVESFNGQRYRINQSNFTQWFSQNAFGGASYSNTPIGAVSHTDEPGGTGVSDVSIYFGLWASGKDFGICAWNCRLTQYFQAVGDPLVTK